MMMMTVSKVPASKCVSNLVRLSSKQVVSRSSCPKIMCNIIDEIPKLHIQATCTHPVIRRSANYKPCSWGFKQIQSLNNPYAGEIYVKRADALKEMVKEMLHDNKKPAVDLFVMIDDLQRLGLSYHFETQIKQLLISLYNKYDIIVQELKQDNDHLYAKALIFRIFRQHGFKVSQDIFDCFKNEKGFFKSSLCEDTKGMLYLYEASYLLVEGENTLELAREFTKKHLKKTITDDNLRALVHHALELPLHWRTLRLEARWFIDIYQGRTDFNPLLLQLAKLDFNILQAKYHQDLKYVTQWWKNTGVVEKLPYARDCIVPSFFWTVGMMGEPKHDHARRMFTKIIALITIIDDTYDVYGTLDELQLFTDAVERWDINAMDQLPDYMKVCFLVLYNSVNEMAYDVLKIHGIHILPYQKKLWADLCKTYLVEAKWYFSGYKPTLEEYIKNAVVTIGVPVASFHAYLLVENSIKTEALEAISNSHDIVRSSAMILRLADDLGTSSAEMKRGDVPKFVQCYMMETGASEDEAREYIRNLISKTWKKMNTDQIANFFPFSETFRKMAMDVDRAGHCVYQFGDEHGNANSKKVFSLLFEPIPIPSIGYRYDKL